MSVVRIYAAALAGALTLAGGPGSAATAVDLQVMVPNLKPDSRVLVAIYNDPNAWAAKGQPWRTLPASVVDGVGVVRLQAPVGNYAVMAFDDANGDKRLNEIAFGWPQEKVGFSGGARPLFGRPDWGKAEFAITPGDRTTVFVRLK